MRDGNGRLVVGLVLTLAAQGAAEELAEGREPPAAPAVERIDPAAARARAEEILAREEAGGRSFDPDFRAQILARLAGASAEDLAAVEERGAGLLPEPKRLGDSAADLVYTPVAPCRIADTRLAGGSLAPGVARSFFVAGGSRFEEQGGNVGGCGVPYGPATAAFVNLASVTPAGSGRLRAWKYGGTSPLVGVLNYAAIAGLNITNGVVVPICDPAAGSCSLDLTVQADSSATDLTMDVMGYFRNVVKAQYRSFSTFAHLPFSYYGPVPNGCSNIGGLYLDVDAPVDGWITVRGSANYNFRHLLGEHNSVSADIGTSATDCSGWGPYTRHQASALLPPEIPTIVYYGWTSHLAPVRVFHVAPGRNRYYFNTTGEGLGPSDGADLVNAFMEATFHPE